MKKNFCVFKLYCFVLNLRYICVKKGVKKIFERYLNLFCLNLFVENKDDKGVKK